MRLLGSMLIVATVCGMIIEAVGGFITFKNLLFQIAHESIHLSFFVDGIVCILESYKRVPMDSWRLFFSLAFFIESAVFHGHQMEQRPLEAAMHSILSGMSFLTGLSFLLATRNPRDVFPHALGIVGVIFQGFWLIVIGYVVYSGAYGDGGESFMIADAYMNAGVLTLFVIMFVGSCYNARRIVIPNGDFSYGGPDIQEYISVAHPPRYQSQDQDQDQDKENEPV